jgi:hypothetical protein
MIPVLLALGLVAILFVTVVAGHPDEFVVSRATRISAPPERIFPHVNELRNWEAWNPWGRLDPNCKMTYEGPPAGVGASFAWSGNNKVGAGRNTITESRPYAFVGFRLEFFKPMAGTNAAQFTFEPEDSQTLVTWTMSGKYNLFSKIFGLVVNCDKMIGDQFDKGLAQMKALVEAAETTATRAASRV